jgi:hypothetical protein
MRPIADRQLNQLFFWFLSRWLVSLNRYINRCRMSSVPASVPLAQAAALQCKARGAVQCSGAPVGGRSRGGMDLPCPPAGPSMAPHRAQSNGGPVQWGPSPMVAPVQLHHKARCYTHTHGHLYRHEGGGPLGPQGCQARSHFRATRAPSMRKPHRCPGFAPSFPSYPGRWGTPS